VFDEVYILFRFNIIL